MRDLEIRGAGNLLGADQSGHVAAVGFELYVGMLDEAVRLLSADSADEAPEPVRMDLPVDAYVPADYVPYEAAKIELHRRVAGAREIADLILLREELEDRFGPVPEPLDNLIKLQDARIKLGRAGRAHGGLPRRAARRVADRARLQRRPRAPRGGPGGGVRVGAEHRPGAGARRARGALPGRRRGGRGHPRGGHPAGPVRSIATLPHRAGHLDLMLLVGTAA